MLAGVAGSNFAAGMDVCVVCCLDKRQNTGQSNKEPRAKRVQENKKNPAGSMDACCELCVLSGRGLCDGPIPPAQ